MEKKHPKKKQQRYIVLGDDDTLIDIRRLSGWKKKKDAEGNIFITFEYIGKEKVEVKYSNMKTPFRELLLYLTLRKVAKIMDSYSL